MDATCTNLGAVNITSSGGVGGYLYSVCFTSPTILYLFLMILRLSSMVQIGLLAPPFLYYMQETIPTM